MERVIKDNLREMMAVLNAFASDQANVDKIRDAALMMAESLDHGGKIISCGNGGSLSDATHFAEELTGRFRENRLALPAVAINDAAYLTCVANDYSYEEVFSRYLEAFGKKGDALLAISTSGNSANVVKAAVFARKSGMKVISLTGKGGGKLSGISDVNIDVNTPSVTYSDRVQEIHIKVIHTLVQLIEKELIYDRQDAQHP